MHLTNKESRTAPGSYSEVFERVGWTPVNVKRKESTLFECLEGFKMIYVNLRNVMNLCCLTYSKSEYTTPYAEKPKDYYYFIFFAFASGIQPSKL